MRIWHPRRLFAAVSVAAVIVAAPLQRGDVAETGRAPPAVRRDGAAAGRSRDADPPRPRRVDPPRPEVSSRPVAHDAAAPPSRTDPARRRRSRPSPRKPATSVAALAQDAARSRPPWLRGGLAEPRRRASDAPRRRRGLTLPAPAPVAPARRRRLPQGRRGRPRRARQGRNRPRPPPRPRMGGAPGRSASDLRRALRLRRRASRTGRATAISRYRQEAELLVHPAAPAEALAFFAAEPPRSSAGKIALARALVATRQDRRGDPDRSARCGAKAVSTPGPRARSCASSARS